MAEGQDDKLKEKILGKILSGNVSMKPKMVFSLRLAALIIVALLVTIVSIFLFNFILFSIRINSQDILLGFGQRGFVAFLAFFPWHLLFIDLMLVAVLELLLRQFRLGYKTPVVYLMLGLIVVSFSIGAYVDRVGGVNERFFMRNGQPHLPSLFREEGRGFRGARHLGLTLCKCTIISIEGNVVYASDLRNVSTIMKIVFPADSSYATTSSLKVGDRIFVAGDEKDGVIEAFGVRKMIENSSRPFKIFHPEN
ncbi:MAG: hypothetical protein A3H57_04430 [Candidatus Taylorbacteria bacterium RIFCSPLOWO2_02_FULL_43_11]|uniref:Uncharacterized protein n=1 Tax=Candidatus Taylorbacteria bacterium RIFCSPHIGHO2_02_FULL_43_32b TaxID=1802306 RepID=A0A1G2MHG6_9BACT|nr:MAG: hypothetical protein A2743_02165 [Candidatus Taylorbacteria bacterium RIFCSPHIGHO2_01_FULL_43_47]OHA22442.1 MAG: hypothetical protein A3C72_03380 [Candidatus Taylorbacteria bacterium RIFCSPHIGHO2_02_FULL_43_32b]OHA31630.1 MAG: hypothetical protein A3B08_04085 [Candidatus Taylorbacteria bacterium RIFCSPLOWO2_01_FULL_43_44]OHA36211.1 MAG: hypothetical protein A3H57_04430 [Candidatus Taylorbacteria bacterium RIFCSPLOWO2_02_FULL_43_11]